MDMRTLHWTSAVIGYNWQLNAVDIFVSLQIQYD
jgi:hypothetical protein